MVSSAACRFLLIEAALLSAVQDRYLLTCSLDST